VVDGKPKFLKWFISVKEGHTGPSKAKNIGSYDLLRELPTRKVRQPERFKYIAPIRKEIFTGGRNLKKAGITKKQQFLRNEKKEKGTKTGGKRTRFPCVVERAAEGKKAGEGKVLGTRRDRKRHRSPTPWGKKDVGT